jgi:hypothetical protein
VQQLCHEAVSAVTPHPALREMNNAT